MAMASTFVTIRASPIVASSSSSAFSNHKKCHEKRQSTAASSSSSRWWAPLFGWSADPDEYISNSKKKKKEEEPDPEGAGSRFPRPGCFTEEKAKQLRRKTVQTASFHDIMYHSAIASRLASDLTSSSSDL